MKRYKDKDKMIYDRFCMFFFYYYLEGWGGGESFTSLFFSFFAEHLVT